MSARPLVIWAAGIVALLFVVAVAWLIWQIGFSSPVGVRPDYRIATNLALDLRYTYDANVLAPAPYDERAEFPLQLDGAGFSFYGKRLRGLGDLLQKDPAEAPEEKLTLGPLLYDLIGSMHAAAFEDWYKLELVGEPDHEDATIGGRLALHQRLTYRITADSPGWPPYFPAVFAAEEEAAGEDAAPREAYIEGWALFTESDLFFFYAVAAEPFTVERRALCTALLDSLEFDAVLGRQPQGGATAIEDGGEPEERAAPVEPAAADPEDEAAPPPGR